MLRSYGDSSMVCWVPELTAERAAWSLALHPRDAQGLGGESGEGRDPLRAPLEAKLLVTPMAAEPG